MAGFGAMELIIILVIIIAIFGASRLAGVGSALGKSVRDFRKTVREDDTADTASVTARRDEAQHSRLR